MDNRFGLIRFPAHPTQQHALPSHATAGQMYYRPDGTPAYNPAGFIFPMAYQPGYVGGTNGSDGNRINVGIEGNGPSQRQMNVKNKRGRPRKHNPDDGSDGPLPLPPIDDSVGSGGRARGRGRGLGRGSGRGRGSSSGLGVEDRFEASDAATTGSTGTGFTPHAIAVRVGEDVSAKIISFSQKGPRSICILTANGVISHVTLHQEATSGGTVTYTGRFEILSLSGSFLLSESGGQRSRTGGLSVSLAGPSGQVLGGAVAGLLTAASPVQVIVGSFAAEGMKEANLAGLHDPSSRQVMGESNTTDSSSSLKGTHNGSLGMPVSPPLSQCSGANQNNVPSLPRRPWD